MRKLLLTAALSIGAASITAIGACNDGPTRPAEAGVFLVRLEMAGPSSIAPGGTAQFKLTATWTDGTVTDVTGQATWTSSHPSIVSIDATGAAVGRERGEAQVTGRFQTRSSLKHVFVLPDGTYRVWGRVTEGGATSLPIAEARVEAGAGADSVATVTDRNGEFKLYGVRSSDTVRISKEGYLPAQQAVQLTGHTFLQIPLTRTGSIARVAGTYTMAITAGPCFSNTPALTADLKHRTYTANVTQTGQTLQVTLGGGNFMPKGSATANRFSGVARASEAQLFLSDDDYYYYRTVPLVAERLDDATVFTIVGTAYLTPAGTGWTGRLDGTLAHHRSMPAEANTLLGRCGSHGHAFTLTR